MEVNICEPTVISCSINYLEYSQPLRRQGFVVGTVLYDRVGLGADGEDDIDRLTLEGEMGWVIGELITIF